MENNEFMVLLNQINDLKTENAELKKKISEHSNSIVLLLLLVIILGVVLAFMAYTMFVDWKPTMDDLRQLKNLLSTSVNYY